MLCYTIPNCFILLLYYTILYYIHLNSYTGWILGTTLLVICSLCASFSLHLLSICALNEHHQLHHQPSSFYSIAKTTMPSLTSVIDIAVGMMMMMMMMVALYVEYSKRQHSYLRNSLKDNKPVSSLY